MKLPLSIFFLALFSFNTAYACRCEATPSVEREFKDSEVVVLARVLAITQVELCETMDPENLMAFESDLDQWGRELLASYSILKVEVQVVRNYKGAEVNERLTIYTAENPNTCGYWSFKKGESFLIYADDQSYLYQMVSHKYQMGSGLEKERTFWTNSCKRTTGDFIYEVRELEDASVASNR